MLNGIVNFSHGPIAGFFGLAIMGILAWLTFNKGTRTAFYVIMVLLVLAGFSQGKILEGLAFGLTMVAIGLATDLDSIDVPFLTGTGFKDVKKVTEQTAPVTPTAALPDDQSVDAKLREEKGKSDAILTQDELDDQKRELDKRNLGEDATGHKPYPYKAKGDGSNTE